MTLERMTELVVPADTAWEILVVNNNCPDDTDQVVAEFKGRLPIRMVSEPAPGKSHPLNRAADDAAGRYLLFTGLPSPQSAQPLPFLTSARSPDRSTPPTFHSARTW